MADSITRLALTAEISKLREQQLEELENVTFVGWEPEYGAAYDRRKGEIRELQRQLASLDETPS